MSEDFAKLFKHPEFGQIVAMMDTTEDTGESYPCIVIHFQPTSNEICKIVIGFNDEKTGRETQQKAFKAMEEEQVVGLVSSYMTRIHKYREKKKQ